MRGKDRAVGGSEKKTGTTLNFTKGNKPRERKTDLSKGGPLGEKARSPFWENLDRPHGKKGSETSAHAQDPFRVKTVFVRTIKKKKSLMLERT